MMKAEKVRICYLFLISFDCGDCTFPKRSHTILNMLNCGFRTVYH